MNITILPPKGCKNEEIRKDITMEGKTVKIVMTYPNGFTVTYLSQDDKNTVTPSGTLIDLGNGVYQVPN